MARPIDIHFPSGVMRRLGNRDGAMGRRKYFSPWAMNVRLEDSLASRLRGGSFTGISAGSRPSSIVYRGRTLTFSGRAVTASRVGESSDISLSSDVSDMLRATLFQFSEAEEQGSSVVALVPNDDQYLLGFTSSETWIQQGDPLSGQRQQISENVGIIGADAWCRAENTIYFLSSRGLYTVGINGSGFAPVSEDQLPEDLIGVSDSDCTLTYHHSDRGVYIHKTGADWFYDTAREQFWPFDTSITDSHVLIGPIKLGPAGKLGLIQSMEGIMGADGGTVTWRLVPGESAEQSAANGKLAITAALDGNAYSSYVRASGSWESGRSQTARPRLTAMWVTIWLSASAAWAYEGLVLGVEPAGDWRK